jgi:hypothetical protein
MQPAGISWRTHHPRPTKTEVEVLNAGAVAGAVGLVITSSPILFSFFHNNRERRLNRYPISTLLMVIHPQATLKVNSGNQ